MKEAAERQREAIFNKLAAEEKQRREEKDYVENMRNELQVELQEEKARAQERADYEKKIRQKEELQAAKDYQLKLVATIERVSRRSECALSCSPYNRMQ